MAKLMMEFLGGYRVTLDGAAVTGFESNKVRALLAYLAVEAQRAHRRESLAALLWPDWPDAAALSNLRYALSDLRKVIGDRTAEPPYLIISREAIQLNPECDYRLDVADFVSLAEGEGIEQLERAVSLYPGEFLEGFSVSEAAPFEDWACLKREQLHRVYRELLHRLAGELETQRKYERALMYARQQVECEAWDESAQRQVMRLLAYSGRRGEAMVQYDVCCKVLELELRTKPAVETVLLYEQIRDGELGAVNLRIANVERLPPVLEASEEEKKPVFVGRESELQELNRRLESAMKGNGCMAFVTGGAGRGKSALLREFAQQACREHPDLLAAAGNCNPYSGVSDPYLPLRGVLRSLMGDVELARSLGMLNQDHLRRLWEIGPKALDALAEHGCYLVDTFIPGSEILSVAEAMGVKTPELRRTVEQAANKPGSMAQQNIFEQYCAVLRAIAREQPLLILLDDLQWADAASAGLLYHLGTRLEGSRMLVVGAYRPEEMALGRDGGRHPLEKCLAECKRRYGDSWLDLTQEDEARGREFVDAFLDSEPNRLGEKFRDQLYEHTEGHALFTIELLRAMQERGDLRRDGEGVWVEGEGIDWGSLPVRVEAVIEERISRLESALRETLSIASVEGEDFTAQVTAKVKEVSERQLLSELSQELEKRHRLVREQGEVQAARQTLSRYRFAHALYQQYLYNHLGAAERRMLHRATAEVLEALYAGNLAEISPQLAYHWGQGRDVGKTREYVLLAGQAALRAYANADAERYFRQALELEPTDEQRAAALAGLGEALRLQAKREEAAQVLREGIEVYRRLGDTGGMARLYSRIGEVLFYVNYQDAWNTCQEGLREVEGAPDSPGVARLLAIAGSMAFHTNNNTAEALCRQAMEMAERVGGLEAQARAMITLAMNMTKAYGKYDETIHLLEKAIPFCEMNGLWYFAGAAHTDLSGWLEDYTWDILSAYENGVQTIKIDLQIGDVDGLFLALGNFVLPAIKLGRLASVESMLGKYLAQSPAPKERIQQFLEDEMKELLFYRGEWIQALEYYRYRLEVRRMWKSVQGIANSNSWIAESQIYLYQYMGAGDLADAEAALLENLEIGANPLIYKTVLAKVYSLQGRFTEAHVLLADLLKAPRKLYMEAKVIHAMSEKRWDQAASIAQTFIRLLNGSSRRWEQARALIDLGDIFTQRGKPGDELLAREAYQQSLEMFCEMGAGGYVRVLEERLSHA